MLESVSPTVEALHREYRVVEARLAQSEVLAERLRQLFDQAEDQVRAERAMLDGLAGVLGISAQRTIDDLDERLRGARLREVAVQVLERHCHAGQAIHYREWFQLVRAEGHAIAGKDPLATFLAQISRASRVEAAGKRSGLYTLRAA
jgi:hypothetical protein